MNRGKRPSASMRTTGAYQDGTVAPATGRVAALDALRGIAIIAMAGYHFCFDLRYAGVTAWDFYRDPFWLHARTLILTSFLLLTGISLALAESTSEGRARFWRHTARIAGCALLVSLASYVLFPRSYIWFGVLHAIAVSLTVARPLVRHPRWALVIGVVVIIVGATVTSSWFDNPGWGWLGFMTMKPVTEDYVPLFPWTGVVLLGIACGAMGMRTGFSAVGVFSRLPASIAWLGRHSLSVYMLHQPLLLAGILIATRA